jgi:hypothetical protein
MLEFSMPDPFLHSSWQTFLGALPFVVLVFAGFLGVDAALSAPRPKRSQPAPPARDLDHGENLFFTEPGSDSSCSPAPK